MRKHTTFVALDDSKRTIVAGILRPGVQGPELRQLPNEPRHLRHLVTRLKREGPVGICYEAGPAGYGLYRQITALRVPCQVIAPALTPRRGPDQDGPPGCGEAGAPVPGGGADAHPRAR